MLGSSNSKELWRTGFTLEDNRTNFVGAERELQEAFVSLNQDHNERALSKKGIKWSFNPPAGSHHGGAWERMKILCSVLHQQTLDDEGFHTVLCEAEAVLNYRPITKLSQDPNDLEALTPNPLLLLKGKPVPPRGLLDVKDLYARRRWKQVRTSRISFGSGGFANIYHYYRNTKSGTRRRVLFLETWSSLWTLQHLESHGC